MYYSKSLLIVKRKFKRLESRFKRAATLGAYIIFTSYTGYHWFQQIPSSKRESPTFDISKFSISVRLRGNWMTMFIHFFCLCPLGFTVKLNRILINETVAYWQARFRLCLSKDPRSVWTSLVRWSFSNTVTKGLELSVYIMVKKVKIIRILGLCPGVPLHWGNNHYIAFLYEPFFSCVYCWVFCIGSCVPVHKDRTNSGYELSTMILYLKGIHTILR